jgi:hypothetical protein
MVVMSESPTIRHRWFQFTIRDVLWLMAVVACLMFARHTDLGWSRYLDEVRKSSDAKLNKQRDDMVKQVNNALIETKKWKSIYEACYAERERERDATKAETMP